MIILLLFAGQHIFTEDPFGESIIGYLSLVSMRSFRFVLIVHSPLNSYLYTLDIGL